jgi:CRP/FNR family transcriptional regulator, cyclic AMP receptor protein
MEWEVLWGLSGPQLEEVLSLGRRRRFARREVIWHESDRADTLHLIRSGRVGIRIATSLGDVVTVAVLGPGEAAGLVAVHASGQFHTTTGVALEAAETLAIRVDDLTEVRRRVPAVNEALIHFIADRALDISGQLAEALYVPAEVRVLKRLISLCGVYDRDEGDVVIPLTQEDLAELAGVTRPTANRVLKKEERRGTLTLTRGSITVIDKDGLANRTK